MNERVVEEIKARIDLADLVASYGIAVRHAGGSAKACCPFHHEKTPSFNINTHRGFYHCFGCGESGDAIKFVQKMDGLTFVEAVKKLAGQLGLKVDADRPDPEAGKRKRLLALMAELAAFYHRCLLTTKEAQLARDYLKKRELDEKTCADWLIGYAPSGMAAILKWAEKYHYTLQDLADAGVVKPPERAGDRGYHRFGGRLMFSIRDKQGRVVAFSGRQLVEQKNSGKYVNSPETPIFKKSNVLFGFDKAAANIAKSPHREAIACEGQIDTIRLHTSGFPVAVASQGTAFTEEHARMLKRVCDSIVLAYDDDAAGHKATVKVGGMMLALEVPVRVAHIPGGDDPDSFLRSKGAAAFQKLIDESESIVAFQVKSARAQEVDPKSIDAVSRVSKAVVATIAKCPSAILRARLMDEAAHLLGLPVAALAEEVGKAKVEGARRALVGESERREEADSTVQSSTIDPQAEPHPGEDAGKVTPPPERELALMSFLLANDRDATLDGLVGEFLPPWIFAHAWTRSFVEAWRISMATGEDRVSPLVQALSPGEQKAWSVKLLASSGCAGSCDKAAAEILQEFIRTIWCAALRRRQGALPATGDARADDERVLLSRQMRCLRLRKWHDVTDIIRNYIDKGEKWT